jgi:hypothetical protein
MMDYVVIGPCPVEEDCVQVGEENYAARAKEECRRFIRLLREVLGEEPDGASFRIKGFDHDFGRYYEVICSFDENSEEAVEYAFNAEGNAPMTWKG